MPLTIDEFWDRRVTLAPGDVLMVARPMRDENGRKFIWRYFFVVTSHRRFAAWAKGYVVGSEKLKDKEVSVQLDDYDWGEVWFMPPDEWPQGVHVFRMQMILLGLIKDIC